MIKHEREKEKSSYQNLEIGKFLKNFITNFFTYV